MANCKTQAGMLGLPSPDIESMELTGDDGQRHTITYFAEPLIDVETREPNHDAAGKTLLAVYPPLIDEY